MCILQKIEEWRSKTGQQRRKNHKITGRSFFFEYIINE